MIRCSILVWMAAGSVAVAADSNNDGCQDEFAANGACVDVDATVDATSTVGANASVHDSATIGPEVALGADVTIGARATLAGRIAHSSNPLPVGANTIVGRGTQLGADHVLGSDVIIGRSVIAGERLTIAAGGGIGYGSEVGDDVTIGADAVVGNLVTLGDFATLGDNAVVARSVMIADGANSGDGAAVNGVVGPDVLIAAGSRIEQGARVRKQADIRAGAAIETSGRVGRGATIEAGATVFGRVASNAIVGAGATVEAGSVVARGGEVCAGSTLPSGSSVTSEGTWPLEGCVLTGPSCDAIKTETPTAPDGMYSIDPDGDGGALPFDVYCDMTTEGGGWVDVVQSYHAPSADTTALSAQFFSGYVGTSLTVSALTGGAGDGVFMYTNQSASHAAALFLTPTVDHSSVRLSYRMQGDEGGSRCSGGNWVPLSGPGYNGGLNSYLVTCLSGFSCIQGTPQNSRDAPISVSNYSLDNINPATTLLAWSGSNNDQSTASGCTRDPNIPSDHEGLFITKLLIR